MTIEFVELDWRGRRVRIEHEWIGRERAGRPLLVASHGAAIAELVWSLYADVIARAGPLPTLIGRDNDIRPFAAAAAPRVELDYHL